MMKSFDDFDICVCIEEIIPEEYEDWLRFCCGEGNKE